MSHFVFFSILLIMFLTSQIKLAYLWCRDTPRFDIGYLYNTSKEFSSQLAPCCDLQLLDIIQFFRISQKRIYREILVPKLLAIAIANGGNTNTPSINFLWAFPFDHFLWEKQTTCTQPTAALYIINILFQWQYTLFAWNTLDFIGIQMIWRSKVM